MKKLLPFDYVIIIGIILIVIIFLISYFNSEERSFKITEDKKTDRIEDLNSRPRYVIQQGVYSFDYYATKVVTEKDNFDEYYKTTSKILLDRGEVSFKYSDYSRSKKVAVNCNGIYQELIIADPIVSLSTWTTFSFKIIEWKAFKNSSTDCFFIYDTLNSEVKPRLFLNVHSNSMKNAPSIRVYDPNKLYIKSFPNLLEATKRQTNIDSKPRRGLRSKPYFKEGVTVTSKIPLLDGEEIVLEYFKHPYTDLDPFDPYEYSTKAKYRPEINNLDTYKKK